MKIPKNIEYKIKQRLKAQQKANILEVEIEKWIEKQGIDNPYCGSHVAIYVEPEMVAQTQINLIESH